jgi:hypothetical protein
MTSTAPPKSPRRRGSAKPLTFTRRKRIRGRNARTHREWQDETGSYLIIWRKQAYGVSLPPQFFALTMPPGFSSEEYRITLDGRPPKPFRTFNAAATACQNHADQTGAAQ